MPNGHDKNLVRLAVACAAHRERYGEWPSQARMDPIVLWDLAQVLDLDNFIRLALHLQLRTKDKGISVGGRGVIDYNDAAASEPDLEAIQRARAWLGVDIRAELHE